MSGKKPFWETKTLAQMNEAEWESLCDGCGQCCLHKLQDYDTGDYYVTDVACQLLDCHSCQCRDYEDRFATVPDCVQLTPKKVYATDWLPETCAYRLLADQKPLPDWHPLITGDPESVHRAGVSVQDKVVAGDPTVDEMANRIQRTLAAVFPGKG